MPTPSTISTVGLAPGVRFQWILRPVPPGMPRTDIAGFVGISERGDLHTPTRIESPGQFVSTFGGPIPGAYLADAVNAFFANGGTTCWIVRVANPDEAVPATLELTYPGSKKVAVQLRASSPGKWAERMLYTCLDLGGGLFTVTFELVDEGLSEQWRGVSFVHGNSRAIDQILEGSALVDAWILEDRISTVLGGRSDAARIDLLDPNDKPRVRLELQGAQTWERRVTVTVTPTGSGQFSMSLNPSDPGVPGLAQIDNFSLDPAIGKSVIAELAGATLLDATATGLKLVAPTSGPLPPVPTTGFLEGADGLDPDPDAKPPLVGLKPFHLSGVGQPPDGEKPWGLATLEAVDEISIVAMPDAARQELPAPAFPPPVPPKCSALDAQAPLPPPVDTTLTFTQDEVIDLNNALITHCMLLQDRVAVLDPPMPDMHVALIDPPIPDIDGDDIIGWRTRFTSSYAALYYPWLLATTSTGDVRAVPPSGAMAGVFARVSLRDSCAKPPANETLEAVAALMADVDDRAHSRLNDYAVNAVRRVGGRGLRILGARTCLAAPGLAEALASGQAPPAMPDPSGLGFVNVRRVVAMVEAVVSARLQQAVFEPNGPRTWRAIERSVRVFLDDLWRAGGLDGASAAEAYLVRCDATTNPQVDIDQGCLTCLVGIRPPWPAEFVFVRVSATAAGVQVQEGGGSG